LEVGGAVAEKGLQVEHALAQHRAVGGKAWFRKLMVMGRMDGVGG
jgi:hypothetical protein